MTTTDKDKDKDTIPDWVPESLKGMVSAMRDMASVMPVGKDVARKMLTDPRMKQVWKTLLGRKVSRRFAANYEFDFFRLRKDEPDPDFPAHLLPETWGFPHVGGFPRGPDDLKHQACAAVFAGVVIELGVPRAPITRTQLENLLNPVASEQCRRMLDDAGWPVTDPAKRAILAGAVDMFEKRAALIESSPYFLERSSRLRNDDEIRSKVRAIAEVTKLIFGNYLYGTVATIANVTLGTDLNEKTIINWSKTLPLPKSTQDPAIKK